MNPTKFLPGRDFGESHVWQACTRLMDWLVEDHGCTQRMAYLLLGVKPDFHVNAYQMALIGKLHYTEGAEILRTSLPRSAAT